MQYLSYTLIALQVCTHTKLGYSCFIIIIVPSVSFFYADACSITGLIHRATSVLSILYIVYIVITWISRYWLAFNLSASYIHTQQTSRGRVWYGTVTRVVFPRNPEEHEYANLLAAT